MLACVYALAGSCCRVQTEFHDAIWEDLQRLHIVPSIVTHTSDYFDLFIQYAEQLIRSGKGYVDDTPQEKVCLT